MSSLPIAANTQLIPAYVSWLRFRTGYYLPWIPTEYSDKAAEDEAYEMVRDDLVVWHGINTLSLMASGEEIEIDCNSPSLKHLLDYALSEIRNFSCSRKSLVQNGMLFGLGIQKKVYKKTRIDFTGLDWYLVDSMKEVDKRRLRLEKTKDSKTKLQWTIWSPETDSFLVLEDKNENKNASDSYSVQGYVWYVNDYEESFPYFFGLCEILYPIVYMKKKVLQYWMTLCEKWSMPQIVVFIDTAKAVIDANIGNQFQSLEDRQREILNSFAQMMKGNVMVADKSYEVKPLEKGSIGNNILKEFLDYADTKIQLVLLGAQLTTQSSSGGGGSYALGAIHQATTRSIVNYMRGRLCEAMLSDLIQDFLARNQSNLRLLGLNPNERVRLRIKDTEETLEEKRSVAYKT